MHASANIVGQRCVNRLLPLWIRQDQSDYKSVRGIAAGIGFASYVADLSSVDSKGLSDKTCEVLARIYMQSPDIAGDVHVGKNMWTWVLTIRASCLGTQAARPRKHALTNSLATHLGNQLTDVCKSGLLW